MREWRLAGHTLKCGAEPGCVIREGDAYCELTGDRWKKLRCAKHAGEPAPATLQPEATISKPVVPSMRRIGTLASKVLRDHKLAAAGHDDD